MKEAERLLTTPQCKAIGPRMRAVGNPPPLFTCCTQRGALEAQREKERTPRNWGNAGLSDSDFDFEVEHEALETWNLTRDEVDLNEWAHAQNKPVAQHDSDTLVTGSRMSETSVYLRISWLILPSVLPDPLEVLAHRMCMYRVQTG